MDVEAHLKLYRTHLNPGEAWTPTRDALHFVFPTEGQGGYLSGRASQPILPGEVLLVSSESDARIGAGSRSPLLYRAFSISQEQLLSLLANGTLTTFQRLVHASRCAHHFPAHSASAQEWHRQVESVSPEFNLAHAGELVRIAAAVLTEVSRVAASREVPPSPGKPRGASPLDQLTIEDLLNHSVSGLASRLRCSQRHLNRIFHHHFGLSAGAVRMELRLLKALSLLRNPEPKVIVVAEKCGFNHLGLFNSCFKRRFGISPGQWRKNATHAPLLPADRAAAQLCRTLVEGVCPWLDQLTPVPPSSALPNSAPPHATVIADSPHHQTLRVRIVDGLCPP